MRNVPSLAGAGEEPRSDIQALFREPPSPGRCKTRFPYLPGRCVILRPPPDTTPASVLNDGKMAQRFLTEASNTTATWSSPPYVGSGTSAAVSDHGLSAHGDFEVDTVSIEVSRDAKGWNRAAMIKNGKLDRAHSRITCRAVRRTGQHRRYVRIRVKEVTCGRTILLARS